MTEDRPRICFVSMESYSTLKPGVANHAGGAGFQLVEIGRRLRDRGYRISFIVGDYGQPREEEIEGFRVFRSNKVAYDRSIVRGLQNLVRLLRAYRRADADVYILRSTRFLAGFCYLIARLLRRRFVFWVANTSNCLRRDREGVPGVVNRLYGVAIRHADLVIAQSGDQQRMLREEFGVEAPQVPNGIDSLADLGNPAPPGYDVLWVGALKQVKQPLVALEMARGNPDLRFAFVGGPGADPEYYERCVEEMEALPNVDYLGFVPPDRVADCYSRARIFLNTSVGANGESWHEGFPNTFLYSWTRGTPTCSLHVDPDEVIRHGDLGVVHQDPAELIRLVRELLTDDERYRRVADNCRRHVAQHHSLETTTDRIEARLAGITTARGEREVDGAG